MVAALNHVELKNGIMLSYRAGIDLNRVFLAVHYIKTDGYKFVNMRAIIEIKNRNCGVKNVNFLKYNCWFVINVIANSYNI